MQPLTEATKQTKAINMSRKVLSYNYNNHNTVYYQLLLKARLESKLGEI